MRWLGAASGGMVQPTPIVDLGISRNGRFAVTSDARCVFRVFDVQTGQGTGEARVPAKWKAKFDHLRAVSVSDDALAFSPDGARVVTCYHEQRIEVRTVSSGKRVSTIASPAPSTFGIAVSIGAKWIAICTDSSTIYVVDLARGTRAHHFKLPKRTLGPVALSPDGRWVAASDQTTTAVWSLASGERKHAVKAGAHSLAFSPDSTQLAIGGSGRLGIVTL